MIYTIVIQTVVRVNIGIINTFLYPGLGTNQQIDKENICFEYRVSTDLYYNVFDGEKQDLALNIYW